MTDEQRKSVALEYLHAFDNGGVTSSQGSILDLFASDAQVYFPKWGLATGKEQIGKLFGDVGGTAQGAPAPPTMAPAAGATCSRSATGRFSACSSIWTRITPGRIRRAIPGS